MNTLILRNALTAEESNIQCVFFFSFFITYTLFLIQLPIGNTLVTLKVCEVLFSCCRFGQKALHQSSPLRLACQTKITTQGKPSFLSQRITCSTLLL